MTGRDAWKAVKGMTWRFIAALLDPKSACPFGCSVRAEPVVMLEPNVVMMLECLADSDCGTNKEGLDELRHHR
jgi:hypothetical protein